MNQANSWIAPGLVPATDYAGSEARSAKKGCGCHGSAQPGAVSELSKAVTRNPILYLVGAFAIGYCLKGKK